MSESKVNIQLSAINPYIESNLPDSTETKARGKDYVL